MEKKLCNVDFRHNKKLTKLGIDLNKKVDKNKVIFNFSDRILSDEQKEVLSLGFDYCIPPSTIPHNQFFLCFEKLCHTIKNCEIYKDRWNHITNSISTVAHDTYKKFKCHVKSIHTPYPSLTPLIALRDDNNIVITKPDKGRGVVILNRDDYFSKLNTILSDSSKFKPIMSDTATHLLKLEDKLNRLLRSIRTSIGEMTYNLLTISGSKPGRLYGLPKIHKIGQPLRPIISAIGTFNYNLAKFLVQLITPLTTNEYTIENSFSFIKEISDLKPLRPVTMASFDIESLFTNVPLSETTDIILNKTTSSLLNSYGLNKTTYRKLLDIAAHNSVFTFNGSIYTQVDGVAMGSPLGPCYANTFLCHHEQTWMNDCPANFKPILYRRYMDDTFLLFNDPSHINPFLSYLNSQHPNIKFTCETEQNNKLSFLDTSITFHNNCFYTSTYRKPTFTGLGLHYLSYIPHIYKLNSLTTLINRAYNICSTWASFHDEVSFLSKYFTTNGYPSYLFYKALRKFLSQKFNPKPASATVNKDIKYIKLPYMGGLSFDLRKSLNKILRRCYPQISFRFVFYNNNTVGNFLKNKEMCNSELCSNVVYLFTCPSCQARYVGSTSRWLRHRILEHKGKSIRTGLQLSKPSFSAIREHSHLHNHPFSNTDFKILTSHLNRFDLIIAESLHIQTMKPELNNTATATTLFTI
ncbi:uncharacterized protein [Penaeus vannamei]|uniref:uncharacterized protein n=1 Tax=Penaeus vannamei TaxID=6689 RepID=UPI00387F874C